MVGRAALRDIEIRVLVQRNREREREFLRGRPSRAALDRGPSRRNVPLAEVRAARLAMRDTPTRRRIDGDVECRVKPNGTITIGGCGAVEGDDRTYTCIDMFGEFTESLSLGAARKTIAERGVPGKPPGPNGDIRILLGHDLQMIPYARTSNRTATVFERFDGTQPGIWFDATLDTTRQDVRTLLSAIERQDITGCSIQFRPLRERWNPEATRRWIDEIELMEISLVGEPANWHTNSSVSVQRASRPVPSAAALAADLARYRDRDRATLARLR